MKITGQFPSDVVAYNVKRNKAHDGQEAALDIVIGATRQQVKDCFGEQFEQLAFGTMYVKKADPENPNSVDTISFLQDRIKPGSNVVFEQHALSIGDEVFSAQPEVLAIEPQSGVERVLITLRIPIDVDRAHRMQCDLKVNEMFDVRFNPSQQSFAGEGFTFTRGNGRGKGNNLGTSEPEAQA